jgi:hypothetical protein
MEMTTTAQPMIEEAKALTVQTLSNRQRAADLWDAIRAFRKQAEAQKETVCRPLKTAWDDAKVPFDTFVKECQGHETTLQGKMSVWDREQERLARIEQARLQAIVDKANAKIEAKAEAKGVEPVLKVAPVVQMPERNITTQAGSVQGRSSKNVYHIKGEKDGEALVWDASCQSVAQLLKDYPALFVLDRVKFNGVAKTGMLDSHSNVSIEETFVYTQRG